METSQENMEIFDDKDDESSSAGGFPPQHRLLAHSHSFTANDSAARKARTWSMISALDLPQQRVTTGTHNHRSLQATPRYFREFTELGRLGEGGFGVVYRCQNLIDDRVYAVKKVNYYLRPKLMFDLDKVADEILHEPKLIAKLDHPNVVRYYQTWIEATRIEVRKRKLSDGGTDTDGYDLDDDLESDGYDSETDMDGFSNSDSYTETDTATVTDSGFSCSGGDILMSLSGGNFKGKKQSGKASFVVELCIQMACYKDRTLKNWLEEDARVVDRSVVSVIFLSLLRGLEYIHGEGLVHRDMKPANIFLGGEGSVAQIPDAVRIGDFGLSKGRQRESKVRRRARTTLKKIHFQDSHIPEDLSSSPGMHHLLGGHTMGVGTPMYSAPEQQEGTYCDSHCDIYSLGIMFAEMLLPPFGTRSEWIQTLLDIRRGTLPKTLEASYPEEAELIKRMVSHDPFDRPDAFEVIDNASFLQRRNECSEDRDRTVLELKARVQALEAEVTALRSDNETLRKESFASLVLS